MKINQNPCKEQAPSPPFLKRGFAGASRDQDACSPL